MERVFTLPEMLAIPAGKMRPIRRRITRDFATFIT